MHHLPSAQVSQSPRQPVSNQSTEELPNLPAPQIRIQDQTSSEVLPTVHKASTENCASLSKKSLSALVPSTHVPQTTCIEQYEKGELSSQSIHPEKLWGHRYHGGNVPKLRQRLQCSEVP